MPLLFELANAGVFNVPAPMVGQADLASGQDLLGVAGKEEGAGTVAFRLRKLATAGRYFG